MPVTLPGISSVQAYLSSHAYSFFQRMFTTLDSASHEALIAFLGEHPLLIKCTSPALNIACYVENDEIRVTPFFTHAKNTIIPTQSIIISGEGHALITLAQSKKGIIPEGIHIEGQVHVLEKLQALLAQIDIDWPQLIEQFIGPTPTAALTSIFSKVVQFSQDNFKQFQSDAHHFITDEKKLIATQTDFTLHRQQLADFRLQLDRAEAKLNFLSQQFSVSAYKP